MDPIVIMSTGRLRREGISPGTITTTQRPVTPRATTAVPIGMRRIPIRGIQMVRTKKKLSRHLRLVAHPYFPTVVGIPLTTRLLQTARMLIRRYQVMAVTALRRTMQRPVSTMEAATMPPGVHLITTVIKLPLARSKRNLLIELDPALSEAEKWLHSLRQSGRVSEVLDWSERCD